MDVISLAYFQAFCSRFQNINSNHSSLPVIATRPLSQLVITLIPNSLDTQIMSRRVVTALGVTAVGAGGYYLYAAGGDPKVAQKKIERMQSLSNYICLIQLAEGYMQTMQ